MKKYSKQWKSSKNPGKQRKFKANAPLATKREMMAVHLSKELRQKHKTRNIIVRKNDKVKVMRGKFKGKLGKVERVDITHMKVYVSGLETEKKSGGKLQMGIHPSNLMINELFLEDKKRKKSLERKAG